jgi:hypothetical protein
LCQEIQSFDRGAVKKRDGLRQWQPEVEAEIIKREIQKDTRVVETSFHGLHSEFCLKS